MSRSQQPNRAGDKVGYDTLVAALAARHGIAKSRGKRFAKLRPYKGPDGRWYLTKMTKGQLKPPSNYGS